MNEDRLLLIVSLWLKGDDIAAYEAFERQAAALMAAHGGRIERVIRRREDSPSPDAPFETHIVSFPNQAAFDAYRNDKRGQGLAEIRAQVIDRTDILIGRDMAAYGDGAQ